MISKNEQERRFNKIVELRNEGDLTIKEIAEKLGVGVQTVCNYTKKAKELGLIEKRKVKRKGKGRIKDIAKFNRIIELYEQEEYLNYEEIAETAGVTDTTVHNYIEKAIKSGLVKKRKIQHKKSPKYDVVIELYKQTDEYLTYEEIANRAGVCVETVVNYVRKARQKGIIEKRSKPKKTLEKPKTIPKEQKMKMTIELYNSEKNLTIKQIADKVGISECTANVYIREAKEKELIVGRRKKRVEEERLLTVSLEEFSEKIRGYIKAKDYKTAIKLMDNFSGYFQDASEEEIMQAKKEIKEELDRARSSYVGEETQNNGKDVAETR